MPFLRLATRCLLLLSLTEASLFGANIGPFAGPEADAEAARLYERANDYLKNVTEGRYSYAYIQFYWKRSGANLDRIVTAYPSSPTAKQVRSGALTLGRFTPTYFKERVLPRLEEKKVAAFDAVNCAIFLYGLESNQDEAGKKALLAAIVQTLCRQIRWSEALAFPVLDAERPWLWNEVLRQASIYHNDKLMAELLANITTEAKPVLLATVAEGLAFRGDTVEELEKFLTANGNAPELRAAAFAGLLRRELQIQRALDAKRPLKGLYDGVDGIQKVEQRADLPGFLATIPAGSAHDAAVRGYAHWLAGLGRIAEARQIAPASAHPALAFSYATWLIAREEFTQALNLAETFSLPAGLAEQYQLHLLQRLAEAGRTTESDTVRARIPARLAALAAYREFRGKLLSTENQLVVRENVFSEPSLTDPNLTGRLICEWSLTPNRTLRGAAPWDAVVFKFAPGFENLPPPKDKKKVEAAGR